MRRYGKALACALTLAAVSGLALAADDSQQFVTKAAQAGMTEVELGKVAAKSQDENVRKYGERMVKDHTAANKELESIARSKQLQVPKQLDGEHKAMVDKLKGMSGQEFDAAYAEHMAMDHSKVISLFKDASNSSDAELSAYAKKTLPTLQDHKKQADSLHSEQRSASAKKEDTASR